MSKPYPAAIPAPFTTASALILLYGVFSRFTHGKYTPTFHAYQLARAPDEHWYLPVIALTLAVGILYPRTRRSMTRLNVLFMGSGVVIRLSQGKSALADAAQAGLALLGAWQA